MSDTTMSRSSVRAATCLVRRQLRLSAGLCLHSGPLFHRLNDLRDVRISALKRFHGKRAGDLFGKGQNDIPARLRVREGEAPLIVRSSLLRRRPPLRAGRPSVGRTEIYFLPSRIAFPCQRGGFAPPAGAARARNDLVYVTVSLSPPPFAKTRLASTSDASSDMMSSAVSTRSRSATRRLA